jgi:hypothetical protein
VFEKFTTDELDAISRQHGASWTDAKRAYIEFERWKNLGLKAGFVAGFLMGIWLIVFALEIHSVLGFIVFFIPLGGGSILAGGILGFVSIAIVEQVFKSTTKTGRLLRVIVEASESNRGSGWSTQVRDDFESDLDSLIQMSQEKGSYLLRRSRLKNDPTVIYEHYAIIVKNNLASTTFRDASKRQSLEFIGNLASLLDSVADDHLVELLEQKSEVAVEAQKFIQRHGSNLESRVSEMKIIVDEYIAMSPNDADSETLRIKTLDFRLQKRCADEFSGWQYLVSGRD